MVEEGVGRGLPQAKACEAAGIPARTFRDWKTSSSLSDGRQTRSSFFSLRAYSDDEVTGIQERFCRKDVCDLSLHQAFYKVLDKGEYWCSCATLYRLFKRLGLNKRRSPAAAGSRRYRPTSYRATAPNQVWTWDITYFKTSRYTGKFYYAYVIVDVYSRFILNAKVYDADNSDYAVEFLNETFDKYGIAPGQLVVHSDNGASMKAAKTLGLLERRGVTFSHSRPRVSNDNPYSESLFRTLKYSGDYLYPRDGFQNLAEAQEWLAGFRHHYNEVHYHRGIRMVTPGSRFRGEDGAILAKRRQVMARAFAAHSERWIQRTVLNCEPVGEVWLNPDNGRLEESRRACAAAV